MDMNIECSRKIIGFCVKNIDYEEIEPNEWREKYVDLNMLYNADELQNFSRKDIMHSVMKLNEMRYITLKDIRPEKATYINACTISDVTIYGHNFYDSIKDDTLWNKTKNIIGNVGNHTVNL